MSRPIQLGSRARASMAMLAAALGAVAPVATVSPVAPGTPQVSTPSIHTFPAWSQRKARKRSRQTGRKIQKRYAR